MVRIIDASEGGFDSGRFPEAACLAAGGAGEMIAVGPRGGALDGLGVDARLVCPRSPFGLLSHGQRLAGGEIRAMGRRPAVLALAQPAGSRLSLELLEGPARAGPLARRWARRLSAFRTVTVRDEADARLWRACGMPGARLEYAAAGELPGLVFGGTRGGLRAQLEVDDDEFLIMPLAAPWSGLDAHRLVFLLGLLRVHGARAVALLPAAAWRLGGGRRFGKHGGLGARVIVIDGAMTPWLPACDAAFVDAARPRDRLADFAPRGALRVLIAAAERAGVPTAIAPGCLLEENPTPAASVAIELRPLIEIVEARAAVRGRRELVHA